MAMQLHWADGERCWLLLIVLASCLLPGACPNNGKQPIHQSAPNEMQPGSTAITITITVTTVITSNITITITLRSGGPDYCNAGGLAAVLFLYRPPSTLSQATLYARTREATASAPAGTHAHTHI